MSIIVTGTIDIDPAVRADAISAFVTCMAPTRAEAGNEGYSFAADLEDEGRFHLIEQWSTDEAIAEHLTTLHFTALMQALGSLGVVSASLTRWSGATPEKVM